METEEVEETTLGDIEDKDVRSYSYISKSG